ncbi:MAG: efflux RND transporter periplasmic adaptor subunit [Planctomycetales bacterium]
MSHRALSILRGVWMLSATVVLVLLIIWILQGPVRATHAAPTAPQQTEESPIRAVGIGRIRISATTPLRKELDLQGAIPRQVKYPLLSVSGVVVARISAGPEPLEERWQFFSQNLANTYADWLKGRADIEFTKNQLQKITSLAAAQEKRHMQIVDRLKSIEKGVIPVKELAAAEADLVQAQLEGQKNIYEAETRNRTAVREVRALERSLSQSGIDPNVLSRAREGMVLISANVPETKVSQIKEGESCEARFFSLPDQVFAGHVEHLGRVLTSERRALKVLFDLSDGKAILRPGMFADVGLGTDPRKAFLVPATAIVHIGKQDFVLKQVAEEEFEAVPVSVAEAHGREVEIRSGLQEHDHIVTRNSILLKPVIVESLGK